MSGALAGRNYTVVGQALVETARQGGNFERYEFAIADDAGGQALLVNGLTGSRREWHLFQSLETPQGFTAYDAAALRQGSQAVIADRTMQIVQLFQSRMLSTSAQPAPSFWSAGVQYGLLARANDKWLLARWNETEIRLFSGRVLSEQEVRAAFAPVEKKPQ